MEGTGHACGKIILVGEHAVVYGVPAIALGIDRGARATAQPLATGPSRLRIEPWGADVEANEADERHLGLAFASILESLRISEPVSVLAEADLPAGGGLGCSAALGVAIARAVASLRNLPDDNDRIREHAAAWEKIFHGNASGVDAAAAALGGALVFTRDGAQSTIEPIATGAPLVFAVGNTGMVSSTRTMVESVARFGRSHPDIVGKTFEGIRAIVRNARLAIEAGDVIGLGRLMDMNQMVLAGLLVSTEEIELLCGIARDAGALGAKLTGAGGGGCVIALAANRAEAERVLEAWKAGGFSGFVAELRRPRTAYGEAQVQP